MAFSCISVCIHVVVLICLATFTAGRSINKRRQQEQFISFLNQDGRTCAQEKVQVTDSEARFDVKGQMSYVFDYEQQQLIFRESTRKGAPCYLTKFDTDIIPSPDDLRKLLAETNKFEMPVEKYQMSLEKSRIQPLVRPKLLLLSEILCQNSQIVQLEEKEEKSADATGAIAERNAFRPKREIGWGEVVVIIIVIIILL